MIRRESGQAAVELAALAPVLALAVLVFAQLALAFRAELAAERAAGRAQAASVLGKPVLAAARAGAPRGHARRGARRRARARVPSGLRLPLPPLEWVHVSRPSPRRRRDPARRTRRGRGRGGGPAAGACARRGGGPGGPGAAARRARHGAADAVALAAASVLGQATATPSMRAAGPRDPRHGGAARAAAERAARLGASSRSRSSAGRATRSPIAVRVRVPLRRRPWSRRAAGFAFAQPEPDPGLPPRGRPRTGRPRAVVAAALAQLGWPYVWGGESRAEGGFDCSGLIDYAFAAAGCPSGDPRRPGCSSSRRHFRTPPRCRRAIWCSPARRRITSVSSSHPVSRSRPRTAARRCTSSRCATATGRAQGGSAAGSAPTGPGGRADGAGVRPGATRPRSRAPRAPSNCRLRSWRRNSRPRAASTRCPLVRRRAGHRAVHARRGPAPGIRGAPRARSSRAGDRRQARLMHDLLERSGGDIATALAAYNAGPAVLPAIGRGRHAPTSPASCGASGGRRRSPPPSRPSSPLRERPPPSGRWRCDCSRTPRSRVRPRPRRWRVRRSTCPGRFAPIHSAATCGRLGAGLVVADRDGGAAAIGRVHEVVGVEAGHRAHRALHRLLIAQLSRDGPLLPG